MSAAKDLSGGKFNRWTVVCSTDERSSNGGVMWLCVCDCGTERTVKGSDLAGGLSKSCGCIQKEVTSENIKHGHNRKEKRSRTYQTWRDMLGRCRNKNHRGYKRYGGRGILVCDSWIGSFEAFLSDMGERPEGKTIDRIETDGNYEPSNCKWSTPKEQANNMSRNRYLEFNGERLTVSQWADKQGISYNTLIARIRRGWAVERALTTS